MYLFELKLKMFFYQNPSNYQRSFLIVMVHIFRLQPLSILSLKAQVLPNLLLLLSENNW